MKPTVTPSSASSTSSSRAERVSGVPILQDEVNRKALDSIGYLVTALHHKKITPDQFSTGIDVLFMAVSGLVTDPDFIHLVTEAQGLINKEKQNVRLSYTEPAQDHSPGDW